MSTDIHCDACQTIGRHVERLLLADTGDEHPAAEHLAAFVTRAMDSFDLEQGDHRHWEQGDPVHLAKAREWTETERRYAAGDR